MHEHLIRVSGSLHAPVVEGSSVLKAGKCCFCVMQDGSREQNSMLLDAINASGKAYLMHAGKLVQRTRAKLAW